MFAPQPIKLWHAVMGRAMGQLAAVWSGWLSSVVCMDRRYLHLLDERQCTRGGAAADHLLRVLEWQIVYFCREIFGNPCPIYVGRVEAT